MPFHEFFGSLCEIFPNVFFIIHKFMRVLFETVWGGPQTDVLDFDGKIELVFPSTNFFPSSKGTIFLLNFEGEKN